MTPNSTAIIDFSAQFGGSDAATAVLPHFRALKAAAKDIAFRGFPYPELAYILRVDGEVHRFGFSGPGHPDFDRDGEYLSIDIGVTKEDRNDIPGRIKSAILESVEVINVAIDQRGVDAFDTDQLRCALELLCSRYSSGGGA